jgi:hypothetical protein
MTDLSIEHIEFTQAVQDDRNSIPIVQGKALAVRVYVGANGGQGPEANGAWKVGGATLDVFHGRTHVVRLRPVNTGRSIIVPSTSDGSIDNARPNASSTLNFVVPARVQYSDGIHLVARINTDRGVPEFPTQASRRNNVSSINVSFVRTRPLRVLGLLFTSPAHPFSMDLWNHIVHGASFVARTYPIPRVLVYGRGSQSYWDKVINPAAADDPYWPGADGSNGLLTRIDTMRLSSRYRNMNWFVLQPWYQPDNCGLMGCGAAWEGPAVGGAATGQDATGENAGTDMAHEIGHSWGLMHTGGVIDGANPNCCPFGTSGLQSTGNINAVYPSTFGFDIAKMQAIAPVTADGSEVHDFMAYSDGPFWISDYSYLKLLHAMEIRPARI